MLKCLYIRVKFYFMFVILKNRKFLLHFILIFYFCKMRKYHRFFRKKSVRNILMIIIIFNVLITFLFLFSKNKKSFFLNHDIKFDIEKTSFSFKITISHKKIKELSKYLSIRVTSQSINFSMNLIDVPQIQMNSESATFSVYPPLNAVYHVYVIYNLVNVLFTSSVVITNPADYDSDYTTMFCFGKDFLTRWCHFTNVCIRSNSIDIFSPYNLKFEDIFLIPGSKPPPFDREEQRITADKINVISNPNDYTFKNVPVQLTSRYFNIRMLWHNIMDLLVPTFWTMTSHYAKVKSEKWGSNENIPYSTAINKYGYDINRSYDIIMYDNEGPYSLFYIKALSDHDLILGSRIKKPRCYQNAYIGLRKTEFEPTLERRQREGLTYQYYIDPEGILGLRKIMLRAADTDCDCSPSIQKPIVIIIKRKQPKPSEPKLEDINATFRNNNETKITQENNEIRKIINMDEVVNATKKLCPFCDVQEIDLQKFDKLGQIRYTCNATMLIGMHGSGLTHGVWLKPSTPENPTAVVEFVPYKFTCKDWYKQMSELFRVQYYAIHTNNINQSRWASWHDPNKVERCHTGEDECKRMRCHDFLRDQSIIVDIEQYTEIVRPFFNQLKDAHNKFAEEN